MGTTTGIQWTDSTFNPVSLPEAFPAFEFAGGESGPYSRPTSADWVRSLRDQCKSAGVPFFFKQWGGKDKAAAGREPDGLMHSEFPA